MQQYIVAKRTLAVTTQRCQQYTLHCCQQCTISVTVHRCKRYIVTKTPSTGLRHPSLEEGAGKRCSECDCYLHSALFRYTGSNSTLLRHTVANSTLLVLQYTVANSTLLPPLLPTVHISVHWCQQYTLFSALFSTIHVTVHYCRQYTVIAHFYSTPLPKVHCCAEMTGPPPTLKSRSDIAPQQAIVLSADDAIFCPF